MFVSRTDLELARGAASTAEFAFKVDQAQQNLAAMRAQRQEIDAVLARSRKTIEECRALLMDLDESPSGF